MLTIPDDIAAILRRIENAGFSAWLVGGSVRDLLMGRAPHDFDIAASASPRRISEIFKKTVPTGEKYGTVTVFCGNSKAEVTAFRTETGYTDHRRPASVTFTGDIRSDLARRDFTVNAIAYNPSRGVFDPFDGRADLRKKRIRAVGNPGERFEEDALRILRAWRFAAQLGFSIEPLTRRAAEREAPLVRSVSAERVKAEFDRILMSPSPLTAFELFRMNIPAVFGGRAPSREITEKIGELPENLPARWAAAIFLTGVKARDALNGLKFDNASGRETLALLEQLGLGLPQGKAELKKRLSGCGPDTFARFLSLHQALTGKDTLPQRELLRGILAGREPFRLGMLAVNGNDLAAAGFPGGPGCGALLKELLDAVIERPELNEKSTLLRMAAEKRPAGGS